jgi:acyl-CoA thioester hydrolase
MSSSPDQPAGQPPAHLPDRHAQVTDTTALPVGLTGAVLPWVSHRTIEFCETDLAGIVHFSNYYRFMESAEAAFFRALGWPMIREEGLLRYGFPRVAASARFARPLRFGDTVAIELDIDHLESSRIHYTFKFSHTGTGKTVATGSMTTAHVRITLPEARMELCAMPEALNALLSSVIALRQSTAARPSTRY